MYLCKEDDEKKKNHQYIEVKHELINVPQKFYLYLTKVWLESILHILSSTPQTFKNLSMKLAATKLCLRSILKLDQVLSACKAVLAALDAASLCTFGTRISGNRTVASYSICKISRVFLMLVILKFFDATHCRT
jgi:hypothetical protein